MDIQFLDNIDFEPLILTIQTTNAKKDESKTIVNSILEWEKSRPKECSCSKSPLEVLLFESNQNKYRLGLEWTCLDVCIPSLTKWLEEKISDIATLSVGEKHITSSKYSYAYISAFNQKKENLLDSVLSSEWPCFSRKPGR